MKKTVSHWRYKFLEETLEDASKKDIISVHQKTDILESYTPKDRLDFIQVVVTIGAILMGLGAILLVSSNWEIIPNLLKVFILLSTVIFTMWVSYLVKKTSINLSKALLILALLIFGASLFLIDLAYQFNIEAYTINFVWALAAVLISAIHKDLLVFIFAHILSFIVILVGFDSFILIEGLFLVSVLFILNANFGYQRLITFLSLSLFQVFLLYFLDYIELLNVYIAFIFLAQGGLIYYFKHDLNKDIFEFIGMVTLGAAAFTLSFPGIFENAFNIENGNVFSLPITFIFVLYLFYLINQNKLTPLIILSIFIVRYYFDTFYETLPRSFFFIIGGALVLGMGIFIERRRRKLDEKA